jgi:hypothetical protein
MTDRKRPQRIQLTDRDLAMFEILSAARFLMPHGFMATKTDKLGHFT